MFIPGVNGNVDDEVGQAERLGMGIDGGMGKGGIKRKCFNFNHK